MYYFMEVYKNDTTKYYISANKEVLEETRKEKEREAIHEEHGENKTVYPLKGGEISWEVFTSPSKIRQTKSREREEGTNLYAYGTKEPDRGSTYYTMNVATNKEDIENLHHDDNLPGSAREEREKEVTQIQHLGTEIVLEADQPPEKM